MHSLSALSFGLWVVAPSVLRTKALLVNRSGLSFHEKPALAAKGQWLPCRHHASIQASSRLRCSRKHTTDPEQTKTRQRQRKKFSRWLRKVWKGMTLPFPQLRELGLQLENDTAIVGLSIQECIIAIASYLLVGVIAFCFVFEDWPIVDALYFSVSTFTTVGTGDVVPQSDAGRAFTCFFGLGGIGFLGLAIATLGSNLALAEKQAIEQAERASRERVIDIFEGLPLVSNTENNQEGKCVVAADSDTKAVLDREPESWSRMLRGTFLKSFPAFATLCFGGLMMGALEGWQWNTSLYYSFITSATIGFGDVAPRTPEGRAWAVVFIPLAVASAGEVLGNVASFVVDRRQIALYDFLCGRDVTFEHLMRMDANRNGQVSKREYVEFMLLEMGLVSLEQIEELHEQFERLDVTNTGYLDMEDLKLMAELRGTTVSNVAKARASKD